MSTETQKNELLEDFQKYLEQSNLEQVTTIDQPDLNTLLSELTELKTEVKTESRQFKNTLDTLSSALSNVQNHNDALSAEITKYSERLEQQQDELVRTLLLEFVDIYDRLTTSLETFHNYRPISTLFKSSRTKDIHFIERVTHGQVMTTRRFEQLLHHYQVQAIDCVNKPFDPVTMIAVDTEYNQKFENNTVLEELHKGFLFKDQILRLAEVKVNKKN